MKPIRIAGAALAALVLPMLISCASAPSPAQWQNPAYKGHRFSRLLVVGIAAGETAGRAFEAALVERLRKKGTPAEAGGRVFAGAPAPEGIGAGAAEAGCDAVLTVRLVVLDAKTVKVPDSLYTLPDPAYESLPDFYRHAAGQAADPGYATAGDLVKLEVNVYDAESDALVYTVLSKSFPKTKAGSRLSSLSRRAVRQLRRSGIF